MTAVARRDRPDVVELRLGSPILSRDVLAELATALDELRPDPRPLVLAGDHPRVFLAGAHLAEIAALDVAAAAPYAAAGRGLMARLRSHPRPVVAAVHGLCAGGGFDLALSCDALAVGPRARFAHPGVRRGLVTGWGGTAQLPGVVAGGRLRAALLAARALPAGDLRLQHLAVAVDNNAEVLDQAVELGRRLVRVEPRRFKLWRELRAAMSIDSFRAVMVLTEGVAAEAPSLEAPRHGGQHAP